MMHKLIITFILFLAGAQYAIAQPPGHASRRFITEYQGSTVEATQFIKFTPASFEKCEFLLNLAKGLGPKTQTTVTGCGIDLPLPDGSPTRPIPSPEEFYIEYEEPALRSRTTQTITVYHLSPEQMAAPEICSGLIAQFHANQANVRCHKPSLK